MSREFVKDPSARKDYQFDWSDWLSGDTISASSWTISPANELSQYAASNTTTTTTIWLQNGTSQKDYTVTNQITTAGGRIEQASFIVRVREQ